MTTQQRPDDGTAAVRLERELAAARADAERWRRAYQRLHHRLPVRVMSAVNAQVARLRGTRAPAGPARTGAPKPTPSGSTAGPAAAPTPAVQSPAVQSQGAVPYRENPTVGARRVEIFDSLLASLPTGRLVDLGAGHGSFSLRAAEAGWTVTAVDARTTRFPDDDRVTWVHADIREVDLDPFDVILCLGLFYHLTAADQVDLIKRCAGRPLIIDTHLDVDQRRPDLTGRVTVEGYEGRLYGENLSSNLASWENQDSFWPTVPSFRRMLGQAGYDVVLTVEPWYLPDRSFFLALPSPH